MVSAVKDGGETALQPAPGAENAPGNRSAPFGCGKADAFRDAVSGLLGMNGDPKHDAGQQALFLVNPCKFLAALCEAGGRVVTNAGERLRTGLLGLGAKGALRGLSPEERAIAGSARGIYRSSELKSLREARPTARARKCASAERWCSTSLACRRAG